MKSVILAQTLPDILHFDLDQNSMFVYNPAIDQFGANILPKDDWYPILASIKGLVVTYSEYFKYAKKGIGQYGSANESSVTCFIVQEPFKLMKSINIMKGYLGQSLYSTMTLLHQADIDLFWYRRTMRKFYWVSSIDKKEEKLEDNGKNDEQFWAQPLPFNSVKNVLLYYAIGVVGSWALFFIELRTILLQFTIGSRRNSKVHFIT
jgi:hypothetical protein